MSAFATVNDVINLWRALSSAEQSRATQLLPIISDLLRDEAHKCGKDLDEMIEDGTITDTTVKLVTVDVVARILRQSTDGDPMTQESQSVGGYSWSGTYSIPGGGMANAIMKNDLKRLGLRRPRVGVISLWH